MNKTALKNFAINARRELIKKVEAKALKIGITEENIKKAEIESSDAIYIDGRQLSKTEKKQRDKLISRINQIGFRRVVEEVAYTWFNRFTALRFMEVNDYLPTGVRVLSSSTPENPEPDIIKEALNIDLEVDKEYVYDLKINNKTEELFKYLIIKQCNDLNKYLPFMFETIDDYTEILFPEGLLAKDSFVRQMTDTSVIPEEDWKNVEIIGWLYQYYIAEEKDRVIKAKKKYKTEEIPYATQLFTPDWIVRYMVQNSLGRYWVESHPEDRDLIENWEFYLENPNPEPDFEEKLAPYINKELKVEDIKCFDPAMGSGHILVYMFDVLFEIYRKCGYLEREIPRLIIENNLYGLDIDDRAYQLACFSVVMKALQYNPRFFRSIEREGLTLNLASIQETNHLNDDDIAYIAGESSGENFDRTKEFIEQFKNAKTFGSLIKVREFDKEFLEERLEYIQNNPAKDVFEDISRQKVLVLLSNLIKQADFMYYKNYDVLITNPPYIDWTYMNKELQNFIATNYPNNSTDLYSSFIESGLLKVKKNGQLAFITPFAWMFIKSFEKLRRHIINSKTISSLIQLEYNAFEVAMVPVCAFTLRNYKVDLTGEFIKLSNFKGVSAQPIKTLEAVKNPSVDYRFSTYTNEFGKIPGSPIAYWVSKKVREIFEKSTPLGEIAEPKTGLQTGDNSRFTRLWFEVNYNNIGFSFKNIEQASESKKKWFPFNKGGRFRKWAGNDEFIVNWENNGEEIRKCKSSCVRNTEFYFKKGITWTKITSSSFSTRFSDYGFIFSDAGMKVFIEDKLIGYIGALLNSNLVDKFLGALSETMNYEKGNIERLPVIISEDQHIQQEIDNIFTTNVEISKNDWDSYEISWDFRKHPLLKYRGENKSLKEAFENWSNFTEKQFNNLKINEEKLNKIFIDIYGLHDELDYRVNEENISINKADKEREIKSFISYAVGCMFGRYSLDEEGLVFAGGDFDPERYKTFKADKDNIIPILSGSYFEDDIVSRFVEFVKVTFGEETLSENLEFIADTLGKKSGETAKETIRRYFLNDFFKDHVQTYKKRPIYWLFTSGKQKAFNCLIYMHRYDKTTLSRIRTDYLHELQTRMDAEKKSLLSIIEGDSTAQEISKAKRELKALEKKIEELKEYDELLHHMADMQIEIDLDDGVAVNYEKFKGLVAKI
jgi:type II restriction/modification system DNA methylase subunit YeeA